jgi:preprotein translocase subunit SecA
MAQRDPLVEYQREGFALYQQMMGSIREESVGFLFNLEVEVTGGDATAAIPTVEARGLGANGASSDRFSYSAPSADNQGEVEVRNQRGQVERAATAKAQQAAAAAAQQQQAQQQGGQQQAQQPQAAPAKGAFGQRVDPNAPAPANRAERRAADRNKR